MEFSHSLILNENALSKLSEQKRPVFVFQWLQYLDRVLTAAKKNDIKDCQNKLVEQLMFYLHQSPGPPIQKLASKCLATVFSVGDTFLLFETVNKCNDTLKSKEDSPALVSKKLGSIRCIGIMYEQLGRMMGRSYEETIHLLIRSIRGSESQTRVEIMLTLRKISIGMGSVITNVYKDIYKAARGGFIDRSNIVRCASARCLTELLKHAQFMYTTELEGLATLCYRSCDGSDHETRYAIANLLASLIFMTQFQRKDKIPIKYKSSKIVSLEEALGILMTGFLRGGVSFLKNTGEIIKGGSSINREVRFVVAHAYLLFTEKMGSVWLERNLGSFLSHVLSLAANPKSASSHVDAVYSRKCISFILRNVLGKMLGEKVQASACKEIMQVIVKEMNNVDMNPENAKDLNQEMLYSQHLLVCALQEIGCLSLGLGTAAFNLLSESTPSLIDITISVLVHPCLSVRLAAAWCLRCICIAVPSHTSYLIDRFLADLEKLKTSPDAITGYSSALAALLGSVHQSSLGIPYSKGKMVFNTAEELLRSASQNSRLSLNRTQAGWLLIGSIMTLGIPVVRSLLPRMLLLWRNSFPRSIKELESEMARGDAFTWQITLESRAGALSAIHSFLQHCPELLSADLERRLLSPIEAALTMLINISGILKNYGHQLKAPAATVRLRLYETLLVFPLHTIESSYSHLLRMIIAEFTLTENPANTVTSQIKSVCNTNESLILGRLLQEMDQYFIEDQWTNLPGSGALEHDPCFIYRHDAVDDLVPGPLPLGITVIDVSILLFGQIFPKLTVKHRLQILDHFAECVKHAKSIRQDAVQLNVLTGILCGLKGLIDYKIPLGHDIRVVLVNLLTGQSLISHNDLLRYAAGEAIGRLAQTAAEPKFTADLTQIAFEKLKTARDVASRTGYSLALGCLHKSVGMGMAIGSSSQHLNTSVSILLALAQDHASSTVQVWALHGLVLIADSGGPMFRGYVEVTLSMAVRLLLNTPQAIVNVHQCIGKLLSTLITTIGPELQGNTLSICELRSSFLCACTIMQDHYDGLVQAESIECLQQLHLFAPKHVNLSTLVPTLLNALSSTHLLLRKAAVSCLRQLVQREAKEVCEHTIALVSTNRDTKAANILQNTESGLPGVLFSMLNTETDMRLILNIHDTILSLLQILAKNNLSQWLNLCKDVLTVTTDSCSINDYSNDGTAISGSEIEETLPKYGNCNASHGNVQYSNECSVHQSEDDQLDFQSDDVSTHPAVQPRWPTRVFAAVCVRKIINTCSNGINCNSDLETDVKWNALSSSDPSIFTEMFQNNGESILLSHMPELIRMSFMAATSDSDPLRLEGLRMLQDIIKHFSLVVDPEYPNHLLLEQYQAQVSAALRPAFIEDTSSLVTAAACQACSAWIGAHVAKDTNDLKRVFQLLVSSIQKLQFKSNGQSLYNESFLTLEKVTILKAWAEIYIVSVQYNNKECGATLLTLVEPHLESLSKFWMAALRDHAMLSLPTEFVSQLPHDGGAFYINEAKESSKVHYAASYPAILHAVSLWLTTSETTDFYTNSENIKSDGNEFYLLFGICLEALCNPKSSESINDIIICLRAMLVLYSSVQAHSRLTADNALSIELCNVLHRVILTQNSQSCQLLCIQILKQVILATSERSDLDTTSKKYSVEDCIYPGQSLVFAGLEICLCGLAHHIPSLKSLNSLLVHSSKPLMQNSFCIESGPILSETLGCLMLLINLCTPTAAVTILPTILYLCTDVLREISSMEYVIMMGAENSIIHIVIEIFRDLASHPYIKDDNIRSTWKLILQSTLAQILDFTKTSSEGTGYSKSNQIYMLKAIEAFFVHSPKEVVVAPNLLYPSINLFIHYLQSSDDATKLQCIKIMRQMFLQSDRYVAATYIKSLAPRLMEYIYFDESRRQMLTEKKLDVAKEAIITIDNLAEHTDAKNRVDVLLLLIPILVSYLLDEEAYKIAGKFRITLHDMGLHFIIKLGTKYTDGFKKILSESPGIRSRVEESLKMKQQNEKRLKANTVSMKTPAVSPLIKLKTNFSNFID